MPSHHLSATVAHWDTVALSLLFTLHVRQSLQMEFSLKKQRQTSISARVSLCCLPLHS
jgi:hypothetical protein